MQYTIVTLLLTYVYDFRVSSLMRTKCWTAICLYPQWMLFRHKTTMVGKRVLYICIHRALGLGLGGSVCWLVAGKHCYIFITTHDAKISNNLLLNIRTFNLQHLY